MLRDFMLRPAIASIVLTIAAALFMTGGELARIQLTGAISFQAALTTFLLIFLVSLTLTSLPLTSVSERLLIISVATVALRGVYSVLAEQNSPTILAPAFGLSILLFSIVLGRYLRGFKIKASFLRWVASTQILVAALLLLVMSGRDNRILQTTVAFSITLIVLSWCYSAPMSRELMANAVVIQIGIFAILIDFARMATLVSLFSIAVASAINKGKFRWISIASFTVLMLGALFSVGTNMRAAPVFGGDKGLSIGTLTLGTSGRARVLSAALSDSTIQQETKSPLAAALDWIFGMPGASREAALSASGGVLDTPLNEYLRFYVDFGAFGLSVVLFAFFWMAILALKLLRTKDERKRAPLMLGLIVALIMFSLTTNMLALSWVLCLVGLVIGCLSRVSTDAYERS